MNFREAEQYLLSLGNEVLAMKLGLENVSKLLEALGNPQNEYLKVQVAGTNGKGSVCAFLDSICREAGIKCGVSTSPHLVSMTERVRIAGRDISEPDFAGLATRVRETSEDLVSDGELESVPTYFEQIIAIALLAFAEAGVELAILETGLGGRLDATTAAKAEICAITRIDFDHQKILGETIEEIAAEKAALIRSDSTVVVGEQKPEAMEVISRRCANVGVRPKLAVQIDPAFEDLSLGFPGRHQIENAKIAVLLAEVLGEQFSITRRNIVAGLKKARHPGRLEFVGDFLLDGAHNLGGANALRSFLEESVERPITMVFGAMRDKDVSEIASTLFPLAGRVVLTKADNPRCFEPAELARSVPDEVASEIHLSDNVAEALRIAKEMTPDDGLVVVTGSLYLVGEARKILAAESQI